MTVRNIARGIRSFTSNAFLVDGERTVLVDTGNDFDAVSNVDAATGDLDAVVLTHTHPDHVGNVPAVVEAFDVEVWGYDGDHDLVDHEVGDGDTVDIGDHPYEVLHTPGHKEDHVCLYAPTAATLFAGDLVFANGGFGRTDLPEGDRDQLIESIEYLLDAVDESLSTMYVGHGPTVDADPRHHIELAHGAARMR
ncbi:beta-lactamase domain protein [Natronomonas pharaonis DSM 2160]|uniref:Beta-lactamase domain protein n=1 Tax=Natronomonas pharaonis (strain ATCC 35678 / DSM 2160 / CIP 103997 / JCM 8858 / NBRC 14720 / NCIMB 2260 / Gabara) TaxID=348780 RepID=A0A1U7EY04_NATPD|nr:MBL fold metallo-hydrolase [Natronomonas pharaonis]CAI50107.1 beta-lactamase domain protein [Natronomonas pharaonis DSM 2160]